MNNNSMYRNISIFIISLAPILSLITLNIYIIAKQYLFYLGYDIVIIIFRVETTQRIVSCTLL